MDRQIVSSPLDIACCKAYNLLFYHFVVFISGSFKEITIGLRFNMFKIYC